MTLDLPQCQEQLGGGGEAKKCQLRGDAGADKNEGGGGGGGAQQKCQSELALTKMRERGGEGPPKGGPFRPGCGLKIQI